MYYSASNKSFYDSPENYENFPSDAVEISDELYDQVVRFRPADKVVVAGEGGLPTLVDAPPPTREQVQAMRRSAFQSEADPLRIEAEGNAIDGGTEPDYSAWLAKRAEIKARFPLPEQ